MEPDQKKYPTGNPMWQYQHLKGYNSHDEVEINTDVTNHDLLLAVLTTGDCLFAELRLIREALERNAT